MKRKKAYGLTHPLAKAYVLDFGTVVVSFVYLEGLLREYVLHRAILAADWPLDLDPGAAFDVELTKMAKYTLRNLVDMFIKHERCDAVVPLLRDIVPKRNVLIHTVLPAVDPEILGPHAKHIAEHRGRFRRITAQTHAAMHAVIAADEGVLDLMELRRAKDPSATLVDTARMRQLLDRRVQEHLATLDT